jgi:DNA-binding transcriptional regulator YiaG
MKTEQCGNCGKTAQVVRRNYHFEEMGIPVELLRIDVVKCSHCGNIDPIIPNMNELMHTLALAVICSPCKLNGEEVRFLRKYVGKSAVEFSRFLHVDHTHLSKVENDRTEIGIRLDKLVRFLVLNLSPELKGVVDKLIDVLPGIEDSCDGAKPDIKIDPSALRHQYA